MTTKNESTKAAPKTIDQVDLSGCVNLSQKIRALHAAGFATSPIGKFLTEQRGKLVRYQHVRNVLVTPVGAASKAD